MKKIIKNLIIFLLMLVICTGTVFAQPTYYKSPSEEHITVVSYDDGDDYSESESSKPKITDKIKEIIPEIIKEEKEVLKDPYTGEIISWDEEYVSQDSQKASAALINPTTGDVESIIRIVVTNISQKDTAANIKITNLLETAYDQIINTEEVDDLLVDSELKVLPFIKERFSNVEGIEDLTEKDFEISDLFDVSAISSEGNLLNYPGYIIEFHLKSPIEENDIFAVLHNYKDDKWMIEENAEIKKGVLIVKAESLSCFAIVRAINNVVEPVGPVVEKENRSLWPLLFILGFILGALLSYIFVKIIANGFHKKRY